MSTQVIKSDGTKMPFDSKKIIRAITRAAQDAKLEAGEINNIVNKVSGIVIDFVESKDKILSSEIRDKILEELDILAPKVSEEWRRFMNERNKA